MIGTVLKRVVPVGVMGAISIGFNTGCDTTRTANGYLKNDLPIKEAWIEAKKSKDFDDTIQIFLGDPNKDDSENVINLPYEDIWENAERMVGQVPFEAYQELTPAASRWLVDTLPSSRAGEGPTKNVLILQDVTRTFDCEDPQAQEKLDYVFSRLKQQCLASDVMRGHFLFLSDKEDKGKEALDLVRGGQPVAMFDPTGSTTSGPAAYSPDQFYVVKTGFGKLERRVPDNMAESYIEFALDVTLAKPIARMDINAKSWTQKYYLHPYRCVWLSEPECEILQRDYDAWLAAKK